MSRLNDQYFKTRETHKKSFKKPWWLLWIIILIVFIGYVYIEIDNHVKYPGILISSQDDSYCVPTEELRIGGISIDEKLNELPKPDSQTRDKDFNTNTWKYKNLQLETVNDEHIYYMKSLNGNVSTPSGLKIGLSKLMTAKILFGQNTNYKEIATQLKNTQIINCETERFLILEFKSDTISKLEIGIDLP